MQQEDWMSEVERQLREARDEQTLAKANTADIQIYSAFPPFAVDTEWQWIKLTSRGTANGEFFYAWDQMIREPLTATTYQWIYGGISGSLDAYPAIELNNSNLPVNDSTRYLARWNPDTSQWIFFLKRRGSGNVTPPYWPSGTACGFGGSYLSIFGTGTIGSGWMSNWSFLDVPPIRGIRIYVKFGSDERLVYSATASWAAGVGVTWTESTNVRFGNPSADNPMTVRVEYDSGTSRVTIASEVAGSPRLCWGGLLSTATLGTVSVNVGGQPYNPTTQWTTCVGVNISYTYNVANVAVPATPTASLKVSYKSDLVGWIGTPPQNPQCLLGASEGYKTKLFTPYKEATLSLVSNTCSSSGSAYGASHSEPSVSCSGVEPKTGTGFDWGVSGSAGFGYYITDATSIGGAYYGTAYGVGVTSATYGWLAAQLLISNPKSGVTWIFNAINSPTLNGTPYSNYFIFSGSGQTPPYIPLGQSWTRTLSAIATVGDYAFSSSPIAGFYGIEYTMEVTVSI